MDLSVLFYERSLKFHGWFEHNFSKGGFNLMKILVVEDEKVVRETLVSLLERSGFADVQYAEDGAAALIELKRGIQYDLVITDKNMPKVSGPELFEQARDLGVPFILVSGRFDDDETRQLLSAGFTAVIRKPYPLKQLLEKMDDALGVSAIT